MGGRLDVREVASGGAVSSRSAAHARRRLLDVRRRIFRDACSRDYDGGGVFLPQRRRKRACRSGHSGGEGDRHPAGLCANVDGLPQAPVQFRESIDVAAEDARTHGSVPTRRRLRGSAFAPRGLAGDDACGCGFAREFDCAMHVHVAEAAYEGEQTRARFGTTPIALLEVWAH